METPITDTDRLDFLAVKIARAYGSEPGEFRDHLDMQIRQTRAAHVPEWIDLTVEFPPDDIAVRVLANDGQTGVVSYCSTAGDWYCYCPDTAIHGRLWSEVSGAKSEIIQWQHRAH